MGERTVTVPVDPIDRGIDRLDTDIRQGKIAEGLNVINDDGDLRRRDAFKSIYAAAPHFHPAGLVSAYRSVEDVVGIVELADRSGAIPVSTTVIYVGSERPFDGVDIASVVNSYVPTRDISFLMKFYHGSGWTKTPSILDTTRLGRYNSGGTKYWFQSLGQAGRISWHKGDIPDWVAGSGTIGILSEDLGSTSRYWIALQFTNGLAEAATTSNLVISAPGIRTFDLAPVNGIFPVRTKKKNVLVICSDRESREGSEQGAMIGLAETQASPTKILHVVHGEGSGTYSKPPIIGYTKSSGSIPTVPVTTGTDTTMGVVDKLERKQVSDTVDWYYSGQTRESEWRGGMVLYLNYPEVITAGSTVSLVQISAPGIVENQYEHHLLNYIGHSSADGEERVIYKNTATDPDTGYVSLYVYDAFSSAPDATTQIKIYRPHSRLEMTPGLQDYEVETNDANTITVNLSRPWTPAIETSVDDEGVHFYIGEEARWSVRAAPYWTSVYDNNSNSLYLTNGNSSLLRFDGKHLRVMTPETDTNKDWHADRYANFLFISQDLKDSLIADGITETAFLEGAPFSSQILVSFLRRLFAVKTAKGGSTLRFSGENAYHVWPSIFQRTIPDEFNREIQGARVLANNMIFWTAQTVMQFSFIGSEMDFDSRIIHNGGGFLSHHGVQQVRSTLVGPNTDGIYACNGPEMLPVLDSWDRLIKGGVNARRLGRASAVVLQDKGWYVLAVSSAGSSYNDRIVIWDYARNRFWLWSAPHGASFLSKDYDENGDERLLIGTDDGHIQTLCGDTSDDGVAIDSYARTVPLNVFGEREGAYTSIQSVVGNSATAMSLKFFVSKRDAESKSVVLNASAGQSVLGTVVCDTGVLGDDRYKTVSSNLNAKGHDFQIEIGGVAPWRLRRMFITARDLGKR